MPNNDDDDDIYNNELRNKNLLKFSSRLKSVAALPCET